MALREEFEATGNWLFRRRSYLPLLLFPILLAALPASRYPEGSHGMDLAWEGFCFLVGLMGLGVRIATVGFVPRDTSGRNTARQIAGSLNTTGMYSIVRHPLYVGNFLMWLGVAAIPRVWWAPVIVALVFWLYYERIMFAEEEFLRRQFGAAYSQWASRTPAFLPRVALWRPAICSFSWRAVLRREHTSLLSLVGSFTALEVASDIVWSGRLMIDPVWGATFGSTAIVCGVLYIAKHRTGLLRETGGR